MQSMALNNANGFKNPDLGSLYDFALKLAKDAGSMLLRGAQTRIDGGALTGQKEKLNAVDIVTDIDMGT